jgi:hypothetical protein
VRFTEPVDGKELLAKPFKGLETAEFEGKQYYRGKEQLAKAPLAGYVADERTLVVADEPTLKKMLAARNAKSPLLELLPKVDLDHDLVFVFLMDQVSTSGPTVRQVMNEVLKKPAKELPPKLAGVEKLGDQVQAATLSLDLSGETLLRLEIEARDEAAAKAVDDLARNGLETLKQLYESQKQLLPALVPPDLRQPLADLADQALANLTETREGNRVVVTLKAPKALPGVVQKLKPLLKDLAAPSPARPPTKPSPGLPKGKTGFRPPEKK